ncbi:MAG TPA: carboxypeptidase-like regulatory domain-containing protein [Chitinophagaceae bacterium]|nr:carboxypeptidase-like regulatory domain-containing protein [Chitinophagaceae bacterium]
MTNSKIYTAADFERYHNGSMPVDEMHALERAALEDPFLADALEGYAFAQTPVKDITDLRSRIYEKKGTEKAVLLFSAKGWRRVAAIVAVATGGIYLFLLVNHTRQPHPAAIAARNQINKDTQPSFIARDTGRGSSIASAGKSPSAALAERKSPAVGEIVNQRPGSGKKNDSGLVGNLKQNASTDTLKFTVAANDKVPGTIANKIPSKKYFLKGRVVDEKGAPVIAATVQNKNSHFSAITDDSGNFMLPSDDSAALAVVSAVGYGSKEIRLQKNERTKIDLAPSGADLDEVAVTGYSSSNKSAAPAMSKMLKRKAAGIATMDSSSDYQRFNGYVLIHRQNLYDSNNVQLTGEVTLSFDVDEDGVPQDIHVLKSTCKGCEENAIGLLKEGPSWSHKKKRQTVSIKY